MPSMPELTNPALNPCPGFEQDFYAWPERHAAKSAAARQRNHRIVFIGDSITHLFEGDPQAAGAYGADLWKKYFSTQSLNLGFGFDRTQNVLWRLDHGELHGQTPDLAVVLIGTNNLANWGSVPACTPPQTAEGVIAICERLHPHAARIILMAILPRGTADDPLRQLITQTNQLLEQQTIPRPWIEFVDIGPAFLALDDSIPLQLMADGCHPTTEGYRIWLAALLARGILLAK